MENNKRRRLNEYPKKLPFKLVGNITNNFSEELGRGAFGRVFKGVLDGDEIAVKMLYFMPGISDYYFQNECEILMRLKHPNVVRLVGFCDEIQEDFAMYNGKQVLCQRIRRALCLEYMPIGSLRKLLSGEYFGKNWPICYKIIKGICEGLKYLHEGLDVSIVHLNLNPDSILLDEKMVPKIADFGSSRLIGEGNTIRAISSVWANGYLPPEFINNQEVSKYYDIYSLGVIILQVITGMIGYLLTTNDMGAQEFIDHVHETWKNYLQEIPKYASIEADYNQVKICIEIAVNCMEKDPCKRPAIKEIVSKLDEMGTMEIDTMATMKTSHNKESIVLPIGNLSRPYQDNNPRKLSYQLVKEITKDFADELGCGSFGKVFKGLFEDEEVAVKVLHRCLTPEVSDRQFENEFQNLRRLKHPNIVRLVGFCDETEDEVIEHKGKFIVCDRIWRALCLEYLPNGSLGKLLSDENLGKSWPIRYKIIKGICKGLQHLQEGLEKPIFHFDLKPDNILVDENMVPKITDFGLSRLIGTGNTVRTMSPLGTIGYLPPEFINNQVISKEYDIFSLGVIITKIITGITGYSVIADMGAQEFIEHVHENWKTCLQDIPKYASLEVDCKQVKRCIEIAVNCMAKERRNRPSIKDVVSKLDEMEKVPSLICYM